MEFEEVLEAAGRGPADLSRLLDARQNEITPQLAASAEEHAREGLTRKDPDMAFRGALAASALYLRLGDRTKSLKWFIECNGVLYVAGDTTENYMSVRSAMLDAIEKANEVSSPELAFQAAVLAAESGFHASDGVESSGEWRRVVLEDVSSACRLALADPSNIWFQRLVYLISAAASEAMGLYGIEDDEQAVQSLRALASWVEDKVPVDFEFSLDSKVNAEIAAQLTTLSSRFS